MIISYSIFSAIFSNVEYPSSIFPFCTCKFEVLNAAKPDRYSLLEEIISSYSGICSIKLLSFVALMNVSTRISFFDLLIETFNW